MADMAPALTGAAQEAPHRLKLSASSTAWKARSGLLLLNGGEKGRLVREDASGGRPDDAPGPGSVGAGEKPLCELELMEVPEGAAGPGRRVGDGPGWRVEGLPGHGKRPQGALGPGHRLEGALGPGKRPEGSTVMGQRVEAAPGPGRRTLGEGRRRPLRVQGSMEHLEGPLVPSPALNSALGPTTCPVPETTSRLDSALGPTTAREDLERRKDGPGEKKMDCVPGPATHTGPQGNAKGHLAGQHLVPEPMRRTEGISEQSALPDCAPGPLPVEPVVSQGCIPGSHAPQDFVPGSLAPQDSASMDSQDTSPGPRVLCALRAAQMSSRQQELGARARRLCRRLQVIQAKQVERHVRQQLSGLVEMLSERGAAGLPGSPHVELDRLACSSTARLRAAQGGFDSDATESSSGGETDEEEVAGTAAESPEHERVEEEQSRASGSNRHSEWRWAVERAAIICRWTWLQAQVSDLEFRIRQQTEIYKQIRCTKGSVVLGDSPHCEDSTTRQTASSSVVLNARGNRVPSSCSKTAPKAPSGNDPCDNLCNTPTPSPQSLDKQCSRLMQSVENVACQNPPTTPVCDSPGSQKTSRQVNGLINCVRSSASCNGSAEDLDPEEVLGKKRRVDTPSTSPALSDSTCVAARTRPLRSHKKRSLVRSSDVASLSRKPQKLLSTKCGCDPPTTCILCGCKTYAKTSHPSTMALNERIALMDPCYHPILSFPYDTPLHLHFEALLKEDRQFRVSNKLKILKLSQFIKKPHEAGSYLHARSEQERLVQYRLENWQKNTRLIYDGTGDRMKSQQQRTPPYPTHSGSMLRDDRQYKGVPSPSIHVSSPVTPRPNTAAHQLPSLNDTPPSASQNSSSAALKRKRFENSYDIDNIVIPMSLVAASRVEKLQYKEILTPSWRVLDSTEKDTMDMDPQLEDLSDEAYQERHSKYEELERSRWDSWTSTVPQRRGSRSSNKSDGRWTPQPPNSQGSSQQMASPDIRFHSLNDVPLSLSSAASDNPEPYSTVQCLSVHSRTRVLSWSEDTRSSTPEIPDDEEQTVQPWEPRSFPLLDRDCRTLQNLPGTPSRSRTKPHPDVSWQTPSKPGAWTESIDSGMSTENLTPASKESPIPNSISVVRVRAHSGDKIASLEYFPARSVNKR